MMENALSKNKILIFSLFSLDDGADLSKALELANPSILCKSGEAFNNVCNRRWYDPATYNSSAVDKTSKMIKCDWNSGEGKCWYKFSADNNTYSQDCSCALNKNGDSYCPVAPGNCNINL